MKTKLAAFLILTGLLLLDGTAYASISPLGAALPGIAIIVLFKFIVPIIIVYIIVSMWRKRLEKQGYSKEDIKRKENKTAYIVLFIVVLTVVYRRFLR